MVQGAVGNAQIACNLRLRFVARSHQLDPFLLKFSCKGSLLLLHDPFPFCGESTLSSLLPPLLWVKTIETPDGLRRCLQVTKERKGGKKPLIATFGGIPLTYKKQAVLIDRLPTPIRYEQKEVIRRLIASTCELCTLKSENCVVHHVRKLADLERMGRGRPHWAHIMVKRRRKTLIVCQACHHSIHHER